MVTGLFSGAILQSGLALYPWARGRDFQRTSRAIAERSAAQLTVMYNEWTSFSLLVVRKNVGGL